MRCDDALSLYSAKNRYGTDFQRLWPKYLFLLKSVFVKGQISLVHFCAFQKIFPLAVSRLRQ